MLKDKMLRYQYYEEDLYTIIAKNDRYFLVNNFKNEVVQKINENTEVIKNLIEISSNFPDIKDQYDENGFKINKRVDLPYFRGTQEYGSIIVLFIEKVQ